MLIDKNRFIKEESCRECTPRKFVELNIEVHGDARWRFSEESWGKVRK
jgi:hypothetical protein